MSVAKYILFVYDPMDGTQLVLATANNEDELVARVEAATNSTDHYSIYAYHSTVSAFGSTQKGHKWRYVRKLKGKKNSGAFPYSPLDYAIKFDNEYAWYYQSH